MTIAIDPRIANARAALLIRHPFFGTLAMRLAVAPRDDIQTMATDGASLYYRPAFLDDAAHGDLVRIIAHEVMHCALNHHTRRGTRDPQRWNIACDHVVNLKLQKAGFKIPPNRYCDARFDGFTAEEVYRILAGEEQTKQDDQPQQQQDDGDQSSPASAGGEPDDDGEQGEESSGDGEGESDGDDDAESDNGESAKDGEPGEGAQASDYPASHGDPGGDGEVLDAAPAHDKAALDEAADEWEVFTRQTLNAERKKGEGKLPGFAEELVDDLDKPRVNWRDVLRRFVDPSSTKDYSWTNPSKRLMSMGYYAPGLVTDGVNHIALLIDTSGSIDHERLRSFGGEAQAALDDGAVDKVTIVFADERVCRTAEYVRGDQIDFTAQGRGGTKFAPTFAWLNDNAPDVSAAIYFTDLDCSDYGEAPAYPVLWAAYGDPRDLKKYIPRVPFGEIIELAE